MTSRTQRLLQLLELLRLRRTPATGADLAGQLGISQRRIWPFALAFFDHARLIAAWCELRQDFRHFRADRVHALTDTGERYPEGRPRLLR